MTPHFKTLDGNEAVARVAYALNEVIAIYPITPSSNMGEWADQWMSENKPNLWGTIPAVAEMQSEGGAAGAIHGALQTGSLATTFTASQGLLLMIPNMFKIAGELTPTVFHIAARSIATHALSIFGDHSDVMSARSTGFAFLASASVQEAHDMALIAHSATLESRIPFLHFFDGFRTSHEVQKIAVLTDADMRAMINMDRVREHRARALTPDRPVLRGTAQNPDVFFQGREAANPHYAACAALVQQAMDKFASLTGRAYKLYEYEGAPDADRVVVLMGSGCEAAHEAVETLIAAGEKVGVLKVRLYRPFDAKLYAEAFPSTVKSIAVLDRTKEPGATGDPLYLDTIHALHEALAEGWGSLQEFPTIVGGRYGLSSKEFTPAMVKAVLDNLKANKPRNRFTVGINDDVGHTSLDTDPAFSSEPAGNYRAVFFGLGADGTVGANKNTIKIVGEQTDNHAQGYFVYDSKKSGAVTVSHLRFGPQRIRSTYLVSEADFVACHQTVFTSRYDMVKYAKPGAVFLLNTPAAPDRVWDTLPKEMQEALIAKKVRLFVIDAYGVAREAGMGGRINTVMQVCFFALSGVLPPDEAIGHIKQTIRDTYGRKGEEIVAMNLRAVDSALERMVEVPLPAQPTSTWGMVPALRADSADPFVSSVLGMISAGRGDEVPVSMLPCDGTFPTATSRHEKRNIALEIPEWDPATCIQCNKCVMVCPHAVIRAKIYEPALSVNAPDGFKSIDFKDRDIKGMKFTIQVSPEDCTGCALCVEVCPAKNKREVRKKAINMVAIEPLLEAESRNWDFFLGLPNPPRERLNPALIRTQQMQEPLFEFSGACGGCGETPYLKLVSQLFGDRMVIANATGCTSIYGGNLPTTPWARNAEGRGPAWSNSLFEDNAEFGLGFRLSIDKQRDYARELVAQLSGQLGDELAASIFGNTQSDEAGIYEMRGAVDALKEKLRTIADPKARELEAVADLLVRKSVWIIGGDGWAYDIGFGGLDHVLASGRNVNILVLDTEVYSNTGGQMSKATPRGAIAKFAAGGRPQRKKDLGLMAMSYGHVYVASVAMGARDEHTLKAFLEAEAYDGPSLIIAYSHCIAHGIDMARGMENQKLAVSSGQWLLYRYHPDKADRGENPISLDSRQPKVPVSDYLMRENRFKMLTKSRPDEARRLFAASQRDAEERFRFYEYLASRGGAPGRREDAPPNEVRPPEPAPAKEGVPQ